jgi:hypothetical protein
VARVRRGSLPLEIFKVNSTKALPDERRKPLTNLMTYGSKHIAFTTNHMETFMEQV